MQNPYNQWEKWDVEIYIVVWLKYAFHPCKYRSFEISSMNLLILPNLPCKY